jgi:hypothetical protein
MIQVMKEDGGVKSISDFDREEWMPILFIGGIFSPIVIVAAVVFLLDKHCRQFCIFMTKTR